MKPLAVAIQRRALKMPRDPVCAGGGVGTAWPLAGSIRGLQEARSRSKGCRKVVNFLSATRARAEYCCQGALVATAAGGIVGLDYAAEYPEQVRRLMVVKSICGV